MSTLTHGAGSNAALAPTVLSLKRSLLARMGIRQRDLTWLGREHLDNFCRAKAKVHAVDRWLETEPMIRADGSAPPVMKIYFQALGASTRQLEALRGVIESMSREDNRFNDALAALEREA